MIIAVKGDPVLHWFALTKLHDWSRKLPPPPQPIGCETKTNHDLAYNVFPRQM